MTISEQSYDGSLVRVGRFATEASRHGFEPAGTIGRIGRLRPMSELVTEAGLLQKRALQLKEHL